MKQLVLNHQRYRSKNTFFPPLQATITFKSRPAWAVSAFKHLYFVTVKSSLYPNITYLIKMCSCGWEEYVNWKASLFWLKMRERISVPVAKWLGYDINSGWVWEVKDEDLTVGCVSDTAAVSWRFSMWFVFFSAVCSLFCVFSVLCVPHRVIHIYNSVLWLLHGGLVVMLAHVVTLRPPCQHYKRRYIFQSKALTLDWHLFMFPLLL